MTGEERPIAESERLVIAKRAELEPGGVVIYTSLTSKLERCVGIRVA